MITKMGVPFNGLAGAGFSGSYVNCTLLPSAEYEPARFSTLGTLLVVMAESGESLS